MSGNHVLEIVLKDAFSKQEREIVIDVLLLSQLAKHLTNRSNNTALMHAVVLAGGYATRLWPITRHRPKMFLPIGETTVIDRILSELETDTRIENVYISTN